MTKRWNELRENLQRAVFSRGVDDVARAIPAHPVTVYRLINGVTQHPSRAIQAGVERVVRGLLQEQPAKD